MQQLLAAYTALLAQKHSDTLEVVEGTNIHEVPSEYLSTKKELLESGNPNQPNTIKVLLAQFEKRLHQIQLKRDAKLHAKGKGISKAGGTWTYT